MLVPPLLFMLWQNVISTTLLLKLETFQATLIEELFVYIELISKYIVVGIATNDTLVVQLIESAPLVTASNYAHKRC